MSDVSPTNDIITGRITPWFTSRMLMMLVLFVGFAGYFFYDYKVGYPKKRVIYDTYLQIESEREALKAAGDNAGAREKFDQWVQTAQEKGWEVNLSTFEPVLKIDDAKIAEQLYWAIGTGVLSLAVLVYFLANLRKTLEVDGEAVTLPSGRRIPFSSIFKVDTRRWGKKGLASIHFTDVKGGESSAKIDGLKFGGFYTPEPYAADLILQRITTSFQGELIEIEEIDDLGEDSGGSREGEGGGEYSKES